MTLWAESPHHEPLSLENQAQCPRFWPPGLDKELSVVLLSRCSQLWPPWGKAQGAMAPLSQGAR